MDASIGTASRWNHTAGLSASDPVAGAGRPIFGQKGAAEKHLENNGVGAGDVFVFFGRFRRGERAASQWQYVRSCRPIHVIFGWLQVAERVPVCEWAGGADWAQYHPHFHRKSHPANVVYVAAERLVLPGLRTPDVPGGGLFPCFTPKLQLTEPSCARTSQWLLPEWFNPQGRDSVLTYHGDHSRWQNAKDGVMLTAERFPFEVISPGKRRSHHLAPSGPST